MRTRARRTIAAFALALLPLSAIAAEPVKSIDLYVQPYYNSAKGPGGKPQVAVGKTFDRLLSSSRREDIVAAEDLVRLKPQLITPMTMMVLAIRLYDVGLRDDSVFWFYAAKDRYLALANVIDVEAAGLSDVEVGDRRLRRTRRSGLQRLRLLRPQEAGGDRGERDRMDGSKSLPGDPHGQPARQARRQ